MARRNEVSTGSDSDRVSSHFGSLGVGTRSLSLPVLTLMPHNQPRIEQESYCAARVAMRAMAWERSKRVKDPCGLKLVPVVLINPF